MSKEKPTSHHHHQIYQDHPVQAAIDRRYLFSLEGIPRKVNRMNTGLLGKLRCRDDYQVDEGEQDWGQTLIKD